MIEFGRLPKVAIVDASVLIEARGDPSQEMPRLVQGFWEAMLDAGNDILIPAPVLGEYLRRPPHKMPPRQTGVEIVSFDEKCALIMAQAFPDRAFKEEKLATGLSLPYLKFDAMIIGMALRHEATCLISLDERQRTLANELKMPAQHPREFVTQYGLDF